MQRQGASEYGSTIWYRIAPQWKAALHHLKSWPGYTPLKERGSPSIWLHHISSPELTPILSAIVFLHSGDCIFIALGMYVSMLLKTLGIRVGFIFGYWSWLNRNNFFARKKNDTLANWIKESSNFILSQLISSSDRYIRDSESDGTVPVNSNWNSSATHLSVFFVFSFAVIGLLEGPA